MVKRTGKRRAKTESRAGFRMHDQERPHRQRAFVDMVTRLAEPLCAAEGMELVHVEYQREPGGLTLRIFIDKPGGVMLDDCVNISRQMEDILDVQTKDAPPYRLEVSSPGVDRPVGKITDFLRFAGYRANIRTATTINGRKNFTGILDGVVDEVIQMKVDKDIVHMNFNDITRARLINYNGEN